MFILNFLKVPERGTAKASLFATDFGQDASAVVRDLEGELAAQQARDAADLALTAKATEVLSGKETDTPDHLFSEERIEGAPLAPQDLSGHDSWTQTYTDPEFFRWLLAHSRSPDAAM